jgi:hypothetical protein
VEVGENRLLHLLEESRNRHSDNVVRILLLEVLILLELSAKYLSCTATLNNDDNPMVCLDAGKDVQAAQRHATSLASRCFVAQLKVWTISVIFSSIPLLMLMHGVLLVLFVCLTSSSSSMNSLARNM